MKNDLLNKSTITYKRIQQKISRLRLPSIKIINQKNRVTFKGLIKLKSFMN